MPSRSLVPSSKYEGRTSRPRRHLGDNHAFHFRGREQFIFVPHFDCGPWPLLSAFVEMSKVGLARELVSGKKKPTMLLNTSEIPTPSGLGSATSTSTISSSSSAHSADLDSPQEWIHPFASSTAKLEIIPSSALIDVEEEARLYDELCRDYEEDTNSVSFFVVKNLTIFDVIPYFLFYFIVYKIQLSNSTYLLPS